LNGYQGIKHFRLVVSVIDNVSVQVAPSCTHLMKTLLLASAYLFPVLS